ncbi:MAG: cell shape determination protein CcmA [Proteobacteria bacterium]|jgi:cytoskeletal protein CcmA (bactofilin family)|nr:cell shape determination protein CcmA [Pseudomonadota bacterium]
MLDKLARKPTEKPCNTIDTLIGVSTDMKGDITFSGGLRIDGKVKGNITARSDDNSTLVLSENAVVTGDVSVPHMIVNGKIKGNVRSAERLELQSRAEINGDVGYKVLEIAAGAQVNGSMTRMGEKGEVVPLKSVDSGRGESD